MSLKKKIVLSFFISAFLIGSLASFDYISFVGIRNEMHFLEVTDTIRSKSLQLRRHEKNYMLYPEKSADEAGAIHAYLKELDEISDSLSLASPDKAWQLGPLISEYRGHFEKVQLLLSSISEEFDSIKQGMVKNREFSPLIEAGFRDRPLFVARFLRKVYSLGPDHKVVRDLEGLDKEILLLRKSGEDIIAVSKVLDKLARDEADHHIYTSQVAILVVVPVFLLLGLGTIFYIVNDVVRRLRLLTNEIEDIGRRFDAGVPEESTEEVVRDEVDVLIGRFHRMNRQLLQWEDELQSKNQELLQQKKLAAIGTLASGVAHELNNPLNNINISAQVLSRQLGGDVSPSVREIVEDIAGQTSRVKGIVGDLLQFAREQEPQLRAVELKPLIRTAYELVGKALKTRGISFVMDFPEDIVTVNADQGQLERVFVNLFSNAVAAMDGAGELVVKAERSEGAVSIIVSDNGKGMPEDDRDKVFDPFFTKSIKGTGLGLAIVLNIIRKHGGTINVVSEEGEGTAFEISLPQES